MPSIRAEAALSFLKDTKGALTWTARDFADTLNINRREALRPACSPRRASPRRQRRMDDNTGR